MSEPDPDIEAQLDALLDEVSQQNPPSVDPAPAASASPTDPIGADLADEIDGLLHEADESAAAAASEAAATTPREEPETVGELDETLADDLDAALDGDFQSLSQIIAEEDDADAAPPAQPVAAIATEPAASADTPESVDATDNTSPAAPAETIPTAASDSDDVEIDGTFDDIATVAAETDDETAQPVAAVASTEPAAETESTGPAEPAEQTAEATTEPRAGDEDELVAGEMQSIDQMLDAETAEAELPPPPADDTEDDEPSPRQSVGAALDDLLGEDDTSAETDANTDDAMAGDMETVEQATADEPAAEPEPEPAAEAPAEAPAEPTADDTPSEPAPEPEPTRTPQPAAVSDQPAGDEHAASSRRPRVDPIAVLATINKPVAVAPDNVRDIVGIIALTTAFWGLFLIAYGLIGFNAAMAVTVLAVPAIGFFVIKTSPNAEADPADAEPVDEASDAGDDAAPERKAA